jgi:hypothetical protein
VREGECWKELEMSLVRLEIESDLRKNHRRLDYMSDLASFENNAPLLFF